MTWKQFLANQRQGTHKSKERGEIAGSTKKIKKQKGTVQLVRVVSERLFSEFGGRVFGPKPRNYSFKLNKKLKQLARKSALTYKAQDNSLVILEDLNFQETPKTKEFISVLKNISVADKKTLVVLGIKQECGTFWQKLAKC